jgi:hypothetical protein
MKNLKETFKQIIHFNESDEHLNLFLDELVFQYSQPWRKYHNVDHVFSLLDSITTEIENDLSEKEMLLLKTGILFHDVIYVPGSSVNEEASADFANTFLLRAGWSFEDVLTIKGLIKSTSFNPTLNHPKHYYVKPYLLAEIIQDLDLLGFSYDEEEFILNQEKVFNELQILKHEKSTPNTFYETIVEAMEKGGRLYKTKYFEHLNIKALENLQQLVKKNNGNNI